MWGWIFGSTPVETEKRKDAPNCLVVDAELKQKEDSSTRYEFIPSLQPAAVARTYKSDIPFMLMGVVDACGVTLPYFELRVELAVPATSLWVGFAEYGGFSLKSQFPYQGYDCVGDFDVGDVVGVGFEPRSRLLYVTKNGAVFKRDIVRLADKVQTEHPVVRVRGGPCRFQCNFGEDAFSFSPFSLTAERASMAVKEALVAEEEKKKKKNKKNKKDGETKE